MICVCISFLRMKIEGSRKGKRLFMWGNGGEDDGDYVHRICTIETGKGGDNRDRTFYSESSARLYTPSYNNFK